MFTVTQPTRNCDPFEVISLRRNLWNVTDGLRPHFTWVSGLVKKWTVEPTKKQQVQKLQQFNGSLSALVQSTSSLMQILHFGASSSPMRFLDFLPALTQYVTGRTYFVTHTIKDEFIMVFYDVDLMYDKSKLNTVASEYLKNGIHSIHYIVFKAVAPGLHYVESQNRYIVHLTCSIRYACGYVASLNGYLSNTSFAINQMQLTCAKVLRHQYEY
ncbi:unnamed protein product [Gongylonema pulchrum]|uniref:Mediator of RNA polymerase II transcription subunit 20 n=1 Tax=Gongylonema pulchrum TaxID=637853 RepID=A0A183D2Q2_9BILA|nr:unnamed protein product [Gongylonema pulchrum]